MRCSYTEELSTICVPLTFTIFMMMIRMIRESSKILFTNIGEINLKYKCVIDFLFDV